ncbi:transcriptional regulator with XRE-family HTH domain [Peribacillus deserti]|uniref:Transcriptional regulator with XRE-family HTH domain n=1 Tax=Peribacillus deserti TaxID=673318 RepID=A0ABS2QLS5_9BACI|nr:helix-turn-helix transcriptional regulator [Peribacillus deserti]MBM7694127.1 transcriptional regulator with XRE-family HTH domain [Peribacillus deserti]
MKLGSIIKYYRLKNHLTQSELAQDICSISHLSKIENNSYDGNAETVELLLKKLNVNMEQEEEKYEELKEDLQSFYDSMVFYDLDTADKQYANLIKQEEFASSTDLINLYHLYLFKYYIYKSDQEKMNQTQKVIEKLNNSFSPFESLLASFMVGLAFVKENKIIEANDQFVTLMTYNPAEAITFNGELYYQTALCASILNDPESSIIHANKALNIYQNENNFVRIIHTKMLLGIGYMRLEMYKEASEIYRSLIRVTRLLHKKVLYYQVLYNYSAMLTEMGDYKKAREFLLECKGHFPRGSLEDIINKLGLIETLIKLNEDKNEIGKIIDDVLTMCDKKQHKKYIIAANMYKYQLFSQPKYYAYLENIVYSYYIDNSLFSEAREVALKLAERFTETGDAKKSLDYYIQYSDLSKKGALK